MSLVYELTSVAGDDALATVAEDLFACFSDHAERVAHGHTLAPGKTHWSLKLDGRDDYSFTLTAPVGGTYALFTEHTPEEFGASLVDESGNEVVPKATHFYNPGHSHDDTVTSVAIEFPGSLDGTKLNTWLGMLLQTQGADIFRMKGIVSVKDEPVRFVFQGVHMLFDSQPGLLWRDEPRYNRLVFIGRNLDRDYLEGAFKSCLC